jgi:O-antigen ligase
MMRGQQLTFPVERFRSVQFWITSAVLVLAPLFFGSVDLSLVAIWTALLSVAVLCGLATPLSVAQSRLLFAFFAVCALYALVAVIQIVPLPIDHLEDPTWRRANGLLGLDLPARISSRAEIPDAAIGHFLLFVTSFASGVFVATSRRNGDLLIRVAQYSILLYAIYGVFALFLTPNMVLWEPKVAYQGNLTATFINHNTAATFVGAGAILWFCWMVSSLQSFTFSSIRFMLLSHSNEDAALKVIRRGAAALICLFALLLTGSRGGLICTCLGLLVAIGLMIASRVRLRLSYILALAGSALVLMALLLARTGRIGSQGLFDDARWRVYGFCIEAIRQRPLLGSGAGTFGDLFPSLRADDFYSWGVWDYAHSTILEIAVEMGLPVAVTIVVAAAVSLLLLARATVSSKDRSRHSLAAISGIATLTYLHSIIDFSLQIPGYFVVFGILLGCGLGHMPSSQIAVDKQQPGEA